MQHSLFHFQPSAPLSARPLFVALFLSSALTCPIAAHAATVCVDQHGKAGCFSTIAAGVAAAAAGDTVQVKPGIYHESVVIKQPLILLGGDRNTTVIDATGLANGVVLSGFDNPALAFGNLEQVTVSGFTVRNANYEGILATSVAHAVIFGNNVVKNDQALHAGTSCLGLPAFETNESSDCGGGIHLIGAVHSTVSDNLVEGNSAGIVLTDETTTTHDNVVSRNVVRKNSESGILLSSNLAYTAPDQPITAALANGLYNNLVVHNLSIENGGGGVVIAATGSANRAYANSVVSNRIVENGAAGIEIHAGLSTVRGAKNGDASRNTLFGNYIAQNGPDAVAPTTVPTGISLGGGSTIIDSLVTENVIERESIAVAFNSASTLELHLNDLVVRGAGVANLNASGAVDGTENWWGCEQGPGTGGCSTVAGSAVTYAPWLMFPADGSRGHGHDLLFNFLAGFSNDGHDEDDHHFGFDL
jgi:parallel beta-helix repeat protein